MISFIADSIILPALPIFLITAGLVMNIRLKFFPFTKPLDILKPLLNKEKTDGVSPLKALCVALAGTLGVGNIAGVAVAISEGGAGAVFWMWVSALFSMILKYSEIVIAMKHRKIRHKDGSCEELNNYKKSRLKAPLLPDCELVGGAMYFIKKRSVALLFAFLCLITSFTVGNILQTNIVAESFEKAFGLKPIVTGIIIAVITFTVIYNGIHGISSFCSAVIPFLTLVYTLMSLYIIFKNLGEIPTVFSEILGSAFSLKSVGVGIGGSLFIKALKTGFARGLITNEAGCGTAPIAHASAENSSPVRQGFLGIIEVFVDTLLLCSMTAFVILLERNGLEGLSGIELVTACFSKYFGRSAEIILSLSVFLFAVATLIGWSFYGKTALGFLTHKRFAEKLYSVIFSLVALIGVFGTPTLVWSLSDITCGAMTFINTSAILIKSSEIKEETDKYFNKRKG